MSRPFPLHCMAAAAALAALPAWPQAPAPAPAASAAAAPIAPGTGYRSTLEQYRPFAEQNLGPWPQANETVRQIGGWRAYAQEAQGGSASGETSRPRDAAPAAGPGKH